MPITRRKRANPPEQPENTNHVGEQAEKASEAPVVEHAPEEAQPAQRAESQQGNVSTPPPSPAPSTPIAPVSPVAPVSSHSMPESMPAPYQPFPGPVIAPTSVTNGERKDPIERPERATRVERGERQEYTPTIEGGRRTSRGELFRRPPQPPLAPPAPAAVVQPALQAPSHEISLPLGNLLHLAYNPGYTGADEARSELLEQLANESKAGGRARCWSCGSIAIVYDRWNTRSKTFGEVGIAFCEICGVWSVM
ncbi:MAG: hypothetical protein PVS3B1_13130 [Ktedonobacteraceae bacterium]